ncbi:MAG: HIT domain-containing protein [Actinobacteria bacterium]|nr:HIT domain-containing protein [Actinomycetota bacterium]
MERLSAAWREQYVQDATAVERTGLSDECVFCDLLSDGACESSGIITVTPFSFLIINAFPYGSGHVLVLPRRHVQGLEDLSDEEAVDFFALLRRSVATLKETYGPDGLNVGFNLGRAAGAGIPQHLHGHIVPRWNGDTNFMTTLGETRVLPESLASTWSKISAVANGSGVTPSAN